MTGHRGRPRSKRRPAGTGSVHWNESRQRWEGWYSHGSGKNRVRKMVTGKGAKEADEKLRKLAERARTNDLSGPATVGQLAERWSAKHPQRCQQTHDRIALHIIADLSIAPIKLHELTTPMVEQWLVDKGTYSHRYLSLMKADLGTMILWAMGRRWASHNPVKGAQVPAVEDTAPKRTLNPEQYGALIEACGFTGRANSRFMLVMLLTGMRPGEVAGLTTEHVDVEANVIHVRRALRRGTGGQPSALGDTKGKRTRSIEVGDEVIAAIQAERKHQVRCRLAAGPHWSRDWDGVVFLTANGTPPWASNLRKSLRLIAQDAGGVLDKLTPYELRHTVASLLCDDGVPVSEIIDQLGHADERMLWTNYRHRVDPVVRNAARIRRIAGDVGT